jgi:hypothetical protein
MRSPRRQDAASDRAALALLSELERRTDGPIPEIALRIWRAGSVRAAIRQHRRAMQRLAREQVREALRACRSWEAADPDRWRDDTVVAMRRLTRVDLRVYWQAYRREMSRGGTARARRL